MYVRMLYYTYYKFIHVRRLRKNRLLLGAHIQAHIYLSWNDGPQRMVKKRKLTERFGICQKAFTATKDFFIRRQFRTKRPAIH